MLLSFDANNHIPGNAPDGYSLYDAAGNLRYDQTTGNYLRYDAENRLIGVGSSVSYVYNGAGQRVEKNLSGVKTDYLYDLASHVITAFQSAGTWQRGEIYAGGWHLGTYYPNATYFSLTDWLGTEHYRTDNLGNLYQTCYDLPFGDGQTCAGTDVSPLHFTGKERDTESGLDNFGARYYGSSLGRFMVPDWASKPTGVPYANFGNPQSLNLYSYVQNNPITADDVDGHETQATLDPQAALEAGETFNKVVQYLNRAVHHPAVQAFIMLYAVGAGSGPAATEESVATSAITTNAAKGAAFEQSVVKATESTDSNVVEQVTLKTQSGVKTRMDVVSTTESGKIRLQEAKSSATAPLTPNQAAAHPEIEQTGATVVGRGKPNYPGGTEIPPTQVEVVRPKNE